MQELHKERINISNLYSSVIGYALSRRREYNPGLIIMTGDSGVGKSTIAQQIAKENHCTILRNDQLRIEAFENPRMDVHEDLIFFQVLENLLVTLLQLGCVVLWDARFPTVSVRKAKAELLRKLKIPFLAIHVYCPDHIRHRRLKARQKRRDLRRECLSFYSSEIESRRLLNWTTYEPPDPSEDYIINFDNASITTSEIQELLCVVASRLNKQ